MEVVFGHSGPVTVAVVVPTEGSLAERHADGTYVGIAVCSPKDVYVRAIGERIAAARAMAELAHEMEDEAVGSAVTKEEAFWAELEDLPQLVGMDLKTKDGALIATHFIPSGLARDLDTVFKSFGLQPEYASGPGS